ncbi:MAG: hypothetical protein ACN4GZ_16615 [Acidimicrobiales bacterium]
MNRFPAMCLVIAIMAGACGSDPQLFYTAETEANFLASCADTDTPEPLPLDAEAATTAQRRQDENLRGLQNRICECAIEQFEQRIPYRTFAEFDAELRADLQKPLQKASIEIVAACIEEEGSL